MKIIIYVSIVITVILIVKDIINLVRSEKNEGNE